MTDNARYWKKHNPGTSRFIIYGLLDTRPDRIGELRYIGKSTRGLVRAMERHNGRCGNWLKAIRGLGLRPDIDILFASETENETELFEDEQLLISYYRFIGCDLTNLSCGGEGPRGHKKTPEHIAKLAAANKGKIVTQETRNRLSQAALARSPEVKAALLAHLATCRGRNKGCKFTEESRKRISEAHKGITYPPRTTEQRAATSDRMKQIWSDRKRLGYSKTPEQRAATGERMKQVWHNKTPEQREAASERLKQNWRSGKRAKNPPKTSEQRAAISEQMKQIWRDRTAKQRSNISEKTKHTWRDAELRAAASHRMKQIRHDRKTKKITTP
jgi:hypothetical protein